MLSELSETPSEQATVGAAALLLLAAAATEALLLLLSATVLRPHAQETACALRVSAATLPLPAGVFLLLFF